jgi:hypothetical protein
LKIEKEPPVGAETAFPINRDMRFSIEIRRSSLDIPLVLQLSKKLLVSKRACRKFGG